MHTIHWAAWFRVALAYLLCIGAAGAVVSLVNPYVGLLTLAAALTLVGVALGPSVRRPAR